MICGLQLRRPFAVFALNESDALVEGIGPACVLARGGAGTRLAGWATDFVRIAEGLGGVTRSQCYQFLSFPCGFEAALVPMPATCRPSTKKSFVLGLQFFDHDITHQTTALFQCARGLVNFFIW